MCLNAKTARWCGVAFSLPLSNFLMRRLVKAAAYRDFEGAYDGRTNLLEVKSGTASWWTKSSK